MALTYYAVYLISQCNMYAAKWATVLFVISIANSAQCSLLSCTVVWRLQPTLLHICKLARLVNSDWDADKQMHVSV